MLYRIGFLNWPRCETIVPGYVRVPSFKPSAVVGSTRTGCPWNVGWLAPFCSRKRKGEYDIRRGAERW